MLTAMGDVLRRCYERGWITTRDGNVSLRRSVDGHLSNQMYITPVGVRKNIIHPEHLVKITIPEGYGNFPSPGPTASTEFWMHYWLQHDAKSTRAVVHVHPTHIVAAMHAGFDIQEIAKQFPEISRYTKVGPTVPAVPAGSKALAQLTCHAFRDPQFEPEVSPILFDIVGQKNHGVCAVGKHPWDAYEHIERLDHICEIILKSGVRP